MNKIVEDKEVKGVFCLYGDSNFYELSSKHSLFLYTWLSISKQRPTYSIIRTLCVGGCHSVNMDVTMLFASQPASMICNFTFIRVRCVTQ